MPFTIVFTFKDEKNKPSRTEINLPSGTAFTDVVLFAKEFAPLVNDLITGQITSIGVCASVSLTGLGLRTAPLSGSDVEEGGRFQFNTVNGFPTAFRLPTFAESFVLANSRNIDTTDADVAAIVTAMEDGIDLSGAGGTGVITPVDKRDEDIVALNYAREQFFNSGS